VRERERGGGTRERENEREGEGEGERERKRGRGTEGRGRGAARAARFLCMHLASGPDSADVPQQGIPGTLIRTCQTDPVRFQFSWKPRNLPPDTVDGSDPLVGYLDAR
jgi:hypothetical protein